MDISIVNWVLDGRGIAIPERNSMKWAEWMLNPGNRCVARTELAGCTVSTIFLGIDCNFGNEMPVLFETMVFQNEFSSMEDAEKLQPIEFVGGGSDWVASSLWGCLRRYSLKGDAIRGHQEAVAGLEKQFGQMQEKVSGLIYGIINAEEWVKDQ